jgi:hypothetical protein
MADLRIDLAAEFKGKKAFKEADKATTSLDKAVGKLGKQLASVFAVTKVVQFGKASVKAFIEDEKAANQLAVAVKNLGLAFAQPEINNYISKLEATSGIVDDQLRPAFQALLTTTGSLTKSQELLGLAIEGARGSGKDLTTVATDLAQAYVGNTRGLRKYNLGLTQTQLKTASFAEVQQKFQQQFSGANQSYLATYAGKLDILAVAADNAKETIGKGLVDALVLAAGKEGDVQDVADAMGALSNYTADAVRGVGVLAGKLGGLDKQFTGGFLSKLLELGTYTSVPNILARLGEGSKPRPTAGRRFMGGAQANLYDSSAAAEKKFRDQQAKLAKDQIKAQKALTAEQKKQAALKKAGTIFDLEQIQIIAALKGQVSAEDRKRLELQFALLLGNEEEASRLTYQLAKAQGLGEQIARDLASLPMANNPFASWEAYLDKIAEKARQIASITVNAPLGTAAAAAASGTVVSSNVSTNVPVMGFTPPPSGTYGTPTGPVQGPQVIELKITGDGDLTNTIAKNLMQQSLSSGNQTYVNRRTGGFE